jgi:hypothetical protein
MSCGEAQRNLREIVRAAALEDPRPGGRFVLPWRMNGDQEQLHKGSEECGCGFCPDDEKNPI